jgi:hypothetical protein
MADNKRVREGKKADRIRERQKVKGKVQERRLTGSEKGWHGERQV